MSEKVIRMLLDDMEDNEVNADGTVVFGLDGTNYEIDLSTKNAAKLRGHLQPFIDRARKAGSRPTRLSTPPRTKSSGSGYDSTQLAAIRDWLRRNGHPELSNKGRIPAPMLEEFEAAQREAPSSPQFSQIAG